MKKEPDDRDMDRFFEEALRGKEDDYWTCKKCGCTMNVDMRNTCGKCDAPRYGK